MPAVALVVGPSGAGKDTLIDAARARLGHDRRFVFARRIVTRSGAHASECHDVMGMPEFDAAEAAGRFLLSWRAHGLGYAIPASCLDVASTARVLVANVSRTVIPPAEARFPSVLVLHVTAPLAVLASRIAARGRETAAEIEHRLARQPAIAARRAQVVEIVNDGAVEASAGLFTDALLALAERRAPAD